MSPAPDPQSRVIGQAISDPAFRKRLLTDPAGTLRRAGVDVPEGVTIEVVEDTATKVHLVLPAREDETLDGELDLAVGGIGCGPVSCESTEECLSCRPTK
jgi:hypothetical protein